MSKTYFGVDISEHNGTVDWTKVAKKVDFAILRIGWVGNTQNKMDKLFEKNYAAAKKAGVKLGAYVYMYTKNALNAKSGAEWILKQIKGKEFELPIYCDMEDPTISKLSKAELTNITIAFNEAIKKGGYVVGTYASRYWFDSKLDKLLRTKYHTWIAHYTSGTNKYKGEYEMWQNSSKGRVDGVSGNVDTNYLYEDIFDKPATTQPVTPSQPAKKSVDEIAKEVIEGKWGNGEDRKKRLTAAGYNYTTVQKKVNELVAPKKKSVTDIAKEVIDGKWGNGLTRRSKLKKAGYDYNAVQKEVNRLLKGK